MRYYLAAQNNRVLEEYTNKIKKLCEEFYWPKKIGIRTLQNDVIYADEMWLIDGILVVPTAVLKIMYEAAKEFSSDELRFTQVGFTGFDDNAEE